MQRAAFALAIFTLTGASASAQSDMSGVWQSRSAAVLASCSSKAA